MPRDPESPVWKLSIEHVISSEKGEKVEELGGGVRKLKKKNSFKISMKIIHSPL